MIRHDDVIKDGWDCQECGHGQEPWDCDLALAVLRKAARGFDFMKGGGSVFIDTGWIDLTPAEEALLHELVEPGAHRGGDRCRLSRPTTQATRSTPPWFVRTTAARWG